MNGEYDETLEELLETYQRGATPSAARLDAVHHDLRRRIATEGEGSGASNRSHGGLRSGVVVVALSLLVGLLLGDDGTPTRELPRVEAVGTALPSSEHEAMEATETEELPPPTPRANEEPLETTPMQVAKPAEQPAPRPKPRLESKTTEGSPSEGSPSEGSPMEASSSISVAMFDPFAVFPSPDPESGDVAAEEPLSDDLARELALVEAARLALNRGGAHAALLSLRTHTLEFPRGLLVAERELLTAEAQCALGQRDAARRTLASFLRSHPGTALADRAHRLCAAEKNDEPLMDGRGSAQ